MDCLSCALKYDFWVSISWCFIVDSTQYRKTKLSLPDRVSKPSCLSVIDTSTVAIIKVQNFIKIFIFTSPSRFISNHKLFHILKPYSLILLHGHHPLPNSSHTRHTHHFNSRSLFHLPIPSVALCTWLPRLHVIHYHFPRALDSIMDKSTGSRTRMHGLNLLLYLLAALTWEKLFNLSAQLCPHR